MLCPTHMEKHTRNHARRENWDINWFEVQPSGEGCKSQSHYMCVCVCVCMCVSAGRRAKDLVSSHLYYLLCLHWGFERRERTESERCRWTCAVRQSMCFACGIRLTSHNETNWTATLRTDKTYSPRWLLTTHTRSFSRAHSRVPPDQAYRFCFKRYRTGTWFWSVFCMSLFMSPSPSFLFACACFCNASVGIWKCVM